MGKSMIPMPTGGGMKGKLIGLLFLAVVLVVFTQAPEQAAGWVNAAISWFKAVVMGIVHFLQSLSA